MCICKHVHNVYVGVIPSGAGFRSICHKRNQKRVLLCLFTTEHWLIRKFDRFKMIPCFSMYFILYTSLNITFCIYSNKLLHVSMFGHAHLNSLCLDFWRAAFLVLHVSSFLFVSLGGLYSLFSSPSISLGAMRNESQGCSASQ